MRRITVKLFGIALIAAAVAGCNSETEPEESRQNGARLMPVETVIVEPGSFNDVIRTTGTVEALNDAVISSESSGRILSILERGARVEQGETIARMDDRLLQSQYESAKTAYELAVDSFERFEALYADSIISTQDYNSARAQRDQARAQLNRAEKQLEDANIQAPFSGRIEERFIRSGELINPGQPVVRLVNTDRIRIVSGVPERYAGDITEGSQAEVKFRALPGETRSAEITYASSVLDSETRTYAIEIEIGNNTGVIKPEMVADLMIERQRIENAIVIPRTAVLRDEDGEFVFIARESDGRITAELVAVQTGLASGALIQIESGIEADDEVVVNGVRSLSSGDELNILRSESSKERAERLKGSVQSGADQS
jgi:membrane fusion protein, multidrug efflux system